MKRIFVLILLVSAFMSCTSCSENTYPFEESAEEIEHVEIVSAETSLDFTVLKALSEAEKNDFLERFRAIPFRTYYIGDPMSVNGTAVKITYYNGDYEMICHYWAESVSDGETHPVRRSCDEKVFHELIEHSLSESC